MDDIKLDNQIRDLLAKGEISIALNSYDDIFSDFDPRSYTQRSLSDDFLREAKRAALDKDESKISLRFLMQERLRKPPIEAKIKKRLHDHFRRHHDLLRHQNVTQVRRGIFMAVAGFALLFAATSIRYYDMQGFLPTLFQVVLEPSGWFTAWFGLDSLFYGQREIKADLDFYRKMRSAEITFQSY